MLRIEPSGGLTGLLLAVEPGLNSARELEEARLLIGQMSNVQAVGIVLIGALLPEELIPSAVGQLGQWCANRDQVGFGGLQQSLGSR